MKVILMKTSRNGGFETSSDISYSQARLPVAGLSCIQLNLFSKRGSIEIYRHTKFMLRQRVALCKLTVGPHCQEQHPNNSLKSNRCLLGVFISMSSLFVMGRYSTGYQKRNMNTNPTTEALTYSMSTL